MNEKIFIKIPKITNSSGFEKININQKKNLIYIFVKSKKNILLRKSYEIYFREKKMFLKLS